MNTINIYHYLSMFKKRKCFLGVTHLADFGSHFRAKIHGFPGFPDRQSSSIKQIQELPGSPGMPKGKGSNDSVPKMLETSH